MRPDAGGDPEPAPHLGAGDAQARPQQVGELGVGGYSGVVGAVGWVGQFAEHAEGQAAVDPMLGFEVLGDLDAERIAHDVGVGCPQPRLGVIDQGQLRPDGCAAAAAGGRT